MDIIHIIILAIIQGLTEFLPISSSAHLILVPIFMDWQDQGIAFDVAVHLGTLSAVVFYFRHEIQRLFKAWLGSITQGNMNADARLAWGVIVGTIPVGLAGLLFKDTVSGLLRASWVIALATLVFAVILWAADVWGRKTRDEYHINWKDIIVIGLFQALALIPGTSRSGATITAGLMLGLTREAAARFSFLLSIPVITLSGLLVGKDLIASDVAVDWLALALGTLLSSISALLCIHYFLQWLQKAGMLPFVIYRLFLGTILLLL